MTDFDDAMRKFRREMLGSMCAHMTDDQIEQFLKPYEALVDALDDLPTRVTVDEPSEPRKPESPEARSGEGPKQSGPED